MCLSIRRLHVSRSVFCGDFSPLFQLAELLGCQYLRSRSGRRRAEGRLTAGCCHCIPFGGQQGRRLVRRLTKQISRTATTIEEGGGGGEAMDLVARPMPPRANAVPLLSHPETIGHRAWRQPSSVR
uniref:Uncharacterized protein n=1 Tax=Plectus sambesii TaxID=2011161 RepID=A0A914UMY9_9BILA